MPAQPTSTSGQSLRGRPALSLRGLNLQDSDSVLAAAGGCALILLGGVGRSSLPKLFFTLAGGALLVRLMKQGGEPGIATAPDERPAAQAGSRVPATQRRTPGGGVADHQGVKLTHTVTVHRSRDEVYRYWRDLKNLPRFLNHVESVRVLDNRLSHWMVRTPGGARSMEWYMEIINDHPGEMIAWQSMPGSDLPNAGTVRFEEDPKGQGTLVRVTMEYQRPESGLSTEAAELLAGNPAEELQEDLGHLKYLLESPDEPAEAEKREEATL